MQTGKSTDRDAGRLTASLAGFTDYVRQNFLWTVGEAGLLAEDPSGGFSRYIPGKSSGPAHISMHVPSLVAADTDFIEKYLATAGSFMGRLDRLLGESLADRGRSHEHPLQIKAVDGDRVYLQVQGLLDDAAASENFLRSLGRREFMRQFLTQALDAGWIASGSILAADAIRGDREMEAAGAGIGLILAAANGHAAHTKRELARRRVGQVQSAESWQQFVSSVGDQLRSGPVR